MDCAECLMHETVKDKINNLEKQVEKLQDKVTYLEVNNGKIDSKFDALMEKIETMDKNSDKNFNDFKVNVSETFDKLNKKIDKLTNEPAKNWSNLKMSILSGIGGSIGTAIIGVIAYFLTMKK